MSLHVEISQQRDVLVVRLDGELDHHSATEVRERIDREWSKGIHGHLVLNLSKLTFMDSSGLGVILGRYRRISEMDGKMVLCAVQPSVYRLFELSGMMKILPFCEDEQTALNVCGVAS
ncbi:anti-sigma F factor antagonist [Kroppenstedtia eburnea]|uniref:Anti-sigma F factor antagonist n=1 Tax=Kroppenstedtia eburnea TaxID=714067 RepID=A0A1N7IN82_9BACL|nr:anti-sigma F factor antagonist [Kroppenstedtia eburnea]QKI82002.1 anti-sigma F factor antagonist [Kroppenstedtia eburnea]SIS38545.1 anti-anti-sigma regulatory factor, SpoIIAA [Kroppenstedtia eburnea]